MNLSSSKLIVRVCLLYALFGVLWIVVTDRLLLLLVPSLLTFALWQMLKGWLFMAASTGIIFFLLVTTQRWQRMAEMARMETEERLRLLSAALEATVNAVVITDVDGNVEWVNPAFTRLTGYTQAEALGKNPRELASSGMHDRDFYAKLWNTILSGQVWQGEIINRRKDGTLYTEEETITPVWNEAGELAHFIAIKQDISERKRAEAELRESEARYRNLFENNHTVILVVDRIGGTIIDANPAAAAYYGWSREELRQKRIGDINTLTPAEIQAEIDRAHHEGRNYFSFKHRLADGRIRDVEVSSGPITLDGRTLLYSIVVDVTERKRAEAEQRFARQQLRRQERLAAIGQLAAGIAHDFNNIMGVIVLYTELLGRSAGLSSKDHKQLAVIKQQANRAAELIQQILDFSRRAVLELQPLDLLPLLKEEVALLERTLPENIEVSLEFEAGEYVVQADPTRIEQMVMNLALNARDAMPEGGHLRLALDHVQVASPERAPLPEMAAGEWIRLALTDTGEGIEAGIIDHIFEPFFTTKWPGKGAGLGLAQAHGIVGQHGGYITVDSRVGQGTTFTLYLPAMVVDTPVATPDEDAEAPRGQGELILVVEDEPALRRALVDGLKQWQYRVLEAADGEEALAILRKRNAEIDLVVSDVVMPRLGGTGLLEAARRQGWGVPLVFLTGHPLDEEMAALRQGGVVATISKPVSLEQLAQVIARALKVEENGLAVAL